MKALISIVLRMVGWAIVVACAVWSAINFTTQPGIAFGLLLGVVLGTTRVAAVDFRQWFRDPGEPLPADDDSPYGLVRDIFHATFRNGVLAIVICALAFAFGPTLRALWPGSWAFWDVLGELLHGWKLVAQIAIGVILDVLNFVAQIVTGSIPDGLKFAVQFAIGIIPDGLKFLGQIAIGIVPVQAIVELIWRFGLTVLPNPKLRTRFLAERRAPYVRQWPEPKAGRRRLIVCCDGTWNWPDGKRETNVIRLVRAIASVDDHGISQLVYYHQGVGTGNIVDRIAGGGAGVGLSLSVKACYGFIVDNYVEGDEIFLFGFSRGAFVARSIAGMIGTVGVLRKADMQKFIPVWNWYSSQDPDPSAIDELVPDRHRSVHIQCVGVWDTVGALGIPGSRFCLQTFAFYQTELGSHVRYAFQALAIDERRGNFQAAVWVPPRIAARQAEQPAAGQLGQAPAAAANRAAQVLKQVWFPGVHSNVGGGYPQHGLSDTTFLWMLAQLNGDGQHEGYKLLGLNPACIKPVLDHSEPYPTGRLMNSLTTCWKLISSPVPRPVCIINETEEVHESAWARGEDTTYPVPRNDIYLRPRRKRWLTAMETKKVKRLDFEKDNAATKRSDEITEAPRRVQAPNNTGFCGWLIRFFGGSG